MLLFYILLTMFLNIIGRASELVNGLNNFFSFSIDGFWWWVIGFIIVGFLDSRKK